MRLLVYLCSGSQPAVITNTTVDVVVPRSLVPAIYGEEGGCLRRIREVCFEIFDDYALNGILDTYIITWSHFQISEAKITITEPRPEAKETLIIISGTPDQTHAAQSLLQAFILSESGGP